MGDSVTGSGTLMVVVVVVLVVVVVIIAAAEGDDSGKRPLILEISLIEFSHQILPISSLATLSPM